MYHGWRFNSLGQCTDRPAETSQISNSMRIPEYKTRKYAGLIFAYMGKDPTPEFDLPRHDAFEREGDLGFTRLEVWPCNWFQHVENSLDPAC